MLAGGEENMRGRERLNIASADDSKNYGTEKAISMLTPNTAAEIIRA